MWSNARPSSRSSVGDQYNNNSNNNPYSRMSAAPKNKPGRTSADPWDWGWDGEEGNSTQQQDDWNSSGWSQSSGQNIIPSSHPNKPKSNIYSQPQKHDRSAHRTPDLIPDKPNNNLGMVYPVGNQRFNSAPPQQHPSEFFENIDLVSNNHKSSPSPKLYNPTDVGRPQPGVDPVFSYFQPQNIPAIQNNPQTIPYFRQSSSPHVPNTDQVPFYQHPTPPPPLAQQQYNQPPSLPRQPQQYPVPPLPQQKYPTPPLPQQSHLPTSFPQQHQQNPLPPGTRQQYHSSPPLPYQHHSPSPSPHQHPLPPLSQLQNHPPQPISQPQNQLPPSHLSQHPPLPLSQHSPPPLSQQHPPPPLPQHPTQPQQQPPVSSYYQNYKNYQPDPTNQTYQQTSYYGQNSFNNNATPTFSTPHNPTEVENVEVPSVSQTPLQPQINSNPAQIIQDSVEDKVPTEEHSEVPDNQETVPDDEEHENSLPTQMAQMRLDSNDPMDAWNNTPGWENQEVAPRCELDRNQYLETGQLLESGEPEETLGRPELDNNDEGELLPPPGLHRMVTGQVTDSPSQRSVLGQPSSETVSDLNGLQRLVPGQQTHNDSPVPTDLSNRQRLIPGQINNEDSQLLDTNSFQRMVPGQNSQLQRLIPGQQQTDSDDPGFQRLIPGRNEGRPPLDTRMIPGQLSDEDTARNQESTLERMVPGGLSEQNSLTEDGLDDERMVPGGLSDMDSRSQSGTNEESRLSSERMIPGRITQLDSNNRLQMDNNSVQPERRISAETERQVTIGSIEPQDPPITQSSGESGRHVMGQGIDSRPSHHRRVVGQPDSHGPDINRAKTPDREVDTIPGNQSLPPRMQRMVLGQFREKDIDSERDPANVERDEDSDSDYHVERRKPRRRKESFGEDGRPRDYSSERDYRGRRDEREKYRKKPEHGYNRSPEYRSDQDEYDRHDFRDRRDRDRRDRPRDRDRRRRSPEYNYDAYYRDDVRKHPRERADRRGERERYYEHYEDDHYYRENRSRPSSRSGSDYRRPVPRDYPTRNPYFPDPVNNYQMHYYQMQQYYENMRRNDPQAYALWYERYMAEKYAAGNNTYGNDRASVHSGRSSANIHDRTRARQGRVKSVSLGTPIFHSTLIPNHQHILLIQDTPTYSSIGLEEEGDGLKAEEQASLRSTPAFYQTAHIRGELNCIGQLVMIQPHDSYEYGEQKAIVDICKLSTTATLADNDDVRDFLQSPGPFIVGVTHKNTVLQYLKRQLDTCRHSSEKLLYELICLVIKLNGVVDMTDVAGLLMDSYNKSIGDIDPYIQQTPTEVIENPQLSQHQVTCKFRELLLEGNKTEALDWAMKNGSWGHALFLASKMDSRTHNNVMLRFANGLHTNDPLQTLYQLMSGREPQAATCAADKRWGDWRPHLAMMLSNRTADPELDRKAILSLGHSLGSRGRIFACHFCYLTAQLDFSSYSDRNSNKLVLLGSSPELPFSQFSSCRSIMLTICYEYAKQLSNKECSIPSLRLYKYLLAVRLIDHNQFTPALAYLEIIAEDIMRAPSRNDRPLATHVLQLADKIKFADSTFSVESDPNIDPDWLARLRQLEETSESNYVSSNLTHGVSTSTVSDTEFYSNGENSSQVPLMTNDVTQNNYYENQQIWTNNQQPAQPNQEVSQVPGLAMEHNIVQQSSEVPSLDYWGNNNMAWSNKAPAPAVEEVQHQSNFTSQPEYKEPEPTQQISVQAGFGYYASTEENFQPQVKSPSPAKSPPKSKPTNRTNKDKVQQSGSGWFGGIWDKLALRPKNQMKLPDDKNPSIVWDEQGKRWINTESNGEDEATQLKPPPRADELPGFGPSPPVVQTPPQQLPVNPVVTSAVPTATSGEPTSTYAPPIGPNKYKLQRGKGMRGNYIDVMNPGGKKPAAAVPTPDVFSAMPQAAVPQNLFIPTPVTGNDAAPVDFISQSGPVSFDNSVPKADDQLPALSRSSSASSLSREVSYYMNRQKTAKRLGGYNSQAVPPMFYNPSSFSS